MSTKGSPILQLAELQLAKLTSESQEIRMRALDTVETRFIRCLQLGEMIDFKPLLLMKQLIRWFGLTPPLAADRVLAIMLELLRSKYGNVVVRKITYERLTTELGKVRLILRPHYSKRVTDLLDELEYLLLQKYDLHLETPSATASSLGSANLTTEGSESLTSSVSVLKGTLTPEDYEPGWTQPCPDDLASMQCLMDLPRNGATNAIEVQVQLTHLSIRMCDYPAEYFLQPPHTFLQLVQLQQRRDGSLQHVNRAIITYLKQLQRRLQIRTNTMSYATSIDAPGSRPQQLKVESALALVLRSSTDLITKCPTSDTWLLLELAKEAIKTYNVALARVSPSITARFADIVKRLLNYCYSQKGTKLSELVCTLIVPRLQSLIFNGLLEEITVLNLSFDKHLNRAHAKALIQPLLLDSCYLNCDPSRLRSLGDLRRALSDNPAEEEDLLKLKRAYNTALNQLQPTKRVVAQQLLEWHQQVCLVLNQLGSKTLVKQLVDAIVQCTTLYPGNPTLKKHAEDLLNTLVDLPDKSLRWYLFGLLRSPVTNHFHAFINKTAYVKGCSNLELVRQNILGLPLSAQFLRKLIRQSWDREAPENVRQWCIDFFILLLKLHGVVAEKDLQSMFQLVFPLLPLLICRSISDSRLENVIWMMWNPDTSLLEPPLMMQIYACYLFHPHPSIREKATIPIACILQSLDKSNKPRPSWNQLISNMPAHDLCKIDPPVNYKEIFSDSTEDAFQGQRSLDALVRLLNTKDLRPSIRKSSMTQLNVLLRNWKACECFTSRDGFSLLVYTLPDGLNQGCPGDPSDILLPAVSILMKLMLQNPEFRARVAHTPELFMNLMRSLLLLPQERQLRQDVSICVFLMLFYDSVTATADKLVIDMELGELLAPVTYEVVAPVPSTAVIEGVQLQQRVDNTYFGGDARSAAQHWRLYTAERMCKTLSCEALQGVDIRSDLKINLCDVAMLQVSQSDMQLRSQLMAASNSSSHDDLQQKVEIIQLTLVNMRNTVPEPEGKCLWQVIHRYVRSAPGNDADRKLYACLLELCLSCLRFGLPQVVKGLSEALETDPNHSFLLLLHDRSISLDVLYLISQCLTQLLAVEADEVQMNWHGKLFLQLSAVARRHFEIRQLQHVRCILRILRRLTERELKLSDVQLMHYCQEFMQLSSDLRTSTQTGAQWQRDCLHIICELHLQHGQRPKKANAMNQTGVTNKVLRYLLGLCGHSDGEVRALSWVLMANWISNVDVSLENILSSLNFLPGGLPACCLTTLLDVHELMIVRVLAGGVFISLMPFVGAEGCIELLRNHTFLKEASQALRSLHVDHRTLKQPEGEQHSCEIISCYVAICVNMVELHPEWCATLCQHSFMNGLSDVMKIPPPRDFSSTVFHELCAEHICELYALCYQLNFDFLQRTICRDTVFLDSFLRLMNEVMDLEACERLLSQLYKMILVFCKDSNSFAFLREEVMTKTAFFIDSFLFGLHQLANGSDLQRYVLKTLTLLLIKSQGGPEEESLVRRLEEYNVPLAPSDPDQDSPVTNASTGPTCKAVMCIYQRLEKLFNNYYAGSNFNFLQVLDPIHIQVCETLGVFLKYSTMAASIAAKTRLLDRVLAILDTFLNDDRIGNACIYVKRVGAHRSQDILNNLLLLLNMIAQWYSSHHSVIKDLTTAATIVHILVRLWPWLSHSSELKQLTVQVSMFFTEHSFEMCKQTSVVLSGQSHSLLQLMSRVADFETTTRKESAHHMENVCTVPALRVMANCCSCAEGRLSLSKMHVLDMFDTILPANPATKVRPPVVQAWLAFWEVYSRYDVGAKACHLHSLIGMIRRLPPLNDRRTLSLRILRNMCFFNINRTQLTDMTEFVNMLRDIINQPVVYKHPTNGLGLISFEEHRLAAIMIYKLFGFGAKYKAMLRGTKLLKLLTALKDQLNALKTEQPDNFAAIPYAGDVAELLGHLFDALQA